MSDAIQKWDAEIKRLMNGGLSRAEAFKSLAKSDPKLRAEYVQSYNATYNVRAAY